MCQRGRHFSRRGRRIRRLDIPEFAGAEETFNSPTSITSFEGAAFEVAVLDGASACAVGAALAGAGATFAGGSISHSSSPTAPNRFIRGVGVLAYELEEVGRTHSPKRGR